RRWLESDETANAIDEDWKCDLDDVTELILGTGASDSSRLLASCLSGPVDIDKLDYLQRDSLHAGVPYGRNFDGQRLLGALCVHPNKPQLAVNSKGRTAAEIMVFSRYVMFSEVYWHHAVRAATAMLQRAVFLLQHRLDLEASFRLTDALWIEMICRAAEGSVAEPLVAGLFGPRRRLYKRVAEFNVLDGHEVHKQLARRPYWWLVLLSERLAERLCRSTGLAVTAADVLVDAPPVKLEVDINVDIVSSSHDGSAPTVRPLGEVSPVASVLAHQQFDDHVKQVRVFVHPTLRDDLRTGVPTVDAWRQHLLAAMNETDQEIA
ncbi:MAG: metal-dependent phosphohydrolase, partial [Planctomycetota bacterium]